MIAVLEEAAPFSSQLAAVGGVLVAGTLAFVPVLRYLVHRMYPGRNVVFARWGFSHAAVALFAAVLAGLAASVATGLVAEDAGPHPILIGLTSMVLLYLAPALVIARVAAVRSPDGLRSLGFWKGHHLRAVVTGLAAYVLCFPGLVGLGWLWPWVLRSLGAGFEMQEHLLVFAELQGGELALGLVLAVVVLPFFEEFVFRGFLQPLLVQNFSDVGGVLLTSILFAWLHGASAFGPVFGLSMLLGALMLRTQRLLCAWAVHALHNGTVLALFLLLPGGEDLLSGPGLLGVLLP